MTIESQTSYAALEGKSKTSPAVSLTRRRARLIIDTIWNVDKLDGVGQLMNLRCLLNDPLDQVHARMRAGDEDARRKNQ